MCSLINDVMTEFVWLFPAMVFVLYLVVSLYLLLDMYEKYYLKMWGAFSGVSGVFIFLQWTYWW